MKTKKPAKSKIRKAATSKAKKPTNGPKDSFVAKDNSAAIALIDEWMKDESGYDERVWPEIKAALEANRLGERKLFRD